MSVRGPALCDTTPTRLQLVQNLARENFRQCKRRISEFSESLREFGDFAVLAPAIDKRVSFISLISRKFLARARQRCVGPLLAMTCEMPWSVSQRKLSF